ncbi:MAG: diguanylate cyclase [Anaerolineae bacterium]|nr:diguanylate cyclase [Anaerolineae bacterium]
MEQKHILVIEDSATQRKYTAHLLEEHGYRVSQAETGQQGIEMASQQPPDLVLLDVVLPDMDGFEVCSELRRSHPLYLPVLMFTERRTSVEDTVDGLSAGANDYLVKPFDPRELTARVAALLRVKEMIDDLLARLADEHHSYQALRRIALTDHLTGAYNRHYLAEALEREFSLAKRHHTPLACIFCDIDDFRQFNNRHGHATGDWVLKSVVQLMQDNLRQGDILARYGGEEFVILLPLTGLEEGGIMAERLRELIASTMWESAVGRLNITLSFGVAALPNDHVHSAERLVELADQALLRAKAEGKNCVRVWHKADSG